MITMNTSNRLLDVQHLSVSVATDRGRDELVHDVSFDIARKEIVVLLGESGSGKTICSRAITRLFPVTAFLKIEGTIQFEGRSLLDIPENELCLIRRKKIRYIFQEPIQSLNPVARIRTQMNLANDSVQNDRSLIEVLASVGLETGKEVLDSYPHQLSIGMAQRVCIAMATMPSPALLIADEPTSAVDASLRYRLLDLLAAIQQKNGLSLLLITHDLNVARQYGDRIIVMHGGQIIESSSRTEFFTAPSHPYSKKLVESLTITGS